jgi:hypothetical protein
MVHSFLKYPHKWGLPEHGKNSTFACTQKWPLTLNLRNNELLVLLSS